jgi:hypothetical protein
MPYFLVLRSDTENPALSYSKEYFVLALKFFAVARQTHPGGVHCELGGCDGQLRDTVSHNLQLVYLTMAA